MQRDERILNPPPFVSYVCNEMHAISVYDAGMSQYSPTQRLPDFFCAESNRTIDQGHRDTKDHSPSLPANFPRKIKSKNQTSDQQWQLRFDARQSNPWSQAGRFRARVPTRSRRVSISLWCGLHELSRTCRRASLAMAVQPPLFHWSFLPSPFSLTGQVSVPSYSYSMQLPEPTAPELATWKGRGRMDATQPQNHNRHNHVDRTRAIKSCREPKDRCGGRSMHRFIGPSPYLWQ
jgi:hypothetical protein